MKPSVLLLFSFFSISSLGAPNVRKVTSTSCHAIRVNLGVGMTTQIVLQQEPKVTLFADKKHFRISTNELAPRSLAVIPFIEASEVNRFDSSPRRSSPRELAQLLDKNFKTNLFIFFEGNNQLMFDLR